MAERKTISAVANDKRIPTWHAGDAPDLERRNAIDMEEEGRETAAPSNNAIDAETTNGVKEEASSEQDVGTLKRDLASMEARMEDKITRDLSQRGEDEDCGKNGECSGLNKPEAAAAGKVNETEDKKLASREEESGRQNEKSASEEPELPSDVSVSEEEQARTSIQPIPPSQQPTDQVAGAYAVRRPNSGTSSAPPTRIASTNAQDIEGGNNYLIEAQLITEGDTTGEELVMAEQMKEEQALSPGVIQCRIIQAVVAAAIIALLITVIVLLVAGDGNQQAAAGMVPVEAVTTVGTAINTTKVTSDQGPEHIVNSEEEEAEDLCFKSTQDLYDALDAFYENSTSSTEVEQQSGWPIGNWCVSKLRVFSHAFQPTRGEFRHTKEAMDAATYFSEDIGDWNMSNAEDLEEMLRGVQNLSSAWGIDRWDTSNIVSLKALFMDTNWTEPLLDLGAWNVSNVQSLSQLFRWSTLETANVSLWDTSKVVDMGQLAERARNYNEDLSQWNTQKVTTMHQAFAQTNRFNQDLSNWDLSSVTRLDEMFDRTSNFNQNLTWDTSNVQTMKKMFAGSAFNSDISHWNVSSATHLGRMFLGAANFSQNLCAWGAQLPLGAVTEEMFAGTACPNTSDPVIPHGPFCFDCKPLQE